MGETFEQAIERCLMDGTTAKALRLIAADFDDESNGFIEIAALQQGADGLDTLVARVAELTASLNRASDACASVQRERDEAVDLLAFAIDQIDYFINANYGGEVPCTDEEFEKFERLRTFLSRYEGEVK